MTCSACAGLDEGAEDCRKCGGTGEVVVADKCPLLVVTPGAWEMLDLASWMEETGLPPVGGGVKDQTVSFMRSLAFIRQTKNAIDAENRAKK